MSRKLLVVSRTDLRRGFDKGEIKRDDLAGSFFAFALIKEVVAEVVGPDLMTIIEVAERDGRVLWRNPDEMEKALGRYMWVEDIIRMLRAKGETVNDQTETSDTEPFNDLLRVLAPAGIGLIW